MVATTLNAEQAGCSRCSRTRTVTALELPAAHGFGVPVVAGLVNGGLATLTREQVNAGGKLVEVGRALIQRAERPCR
jgi:hypothetical protein